MSILRFGFSAIGETLAEVIEELDSHVRTTMASLDGEPWITVLDDYKLVPIAHDLRNPKSFIYTGEREIMFGGPSVIGDLNPWQDGFRPQGKSDLG